MNKQAGEPHVILRPLRPLLPHIAQSKDIWKLSLHPKKAYVSRT